MLETSARLLRLLSLLQARPEWTGPELAARLAVTTRTIRNDVTRLREGLAWVQANLWQTDHLQEWADAYYGGVQKLAPDAALRIAQVYGAPGVGAGPDALLRPVDQLRTRRRKCFRVDWHEARHVGRQHLCVRQQVRGER